MKVVLASSLLALGVFAAAPAPAQRLEVGPDGPGVDLRSREQRAIDRENARRDVDRREMRRERRELRRPDAYDDDDDD